MNRLKIVVCVKPVKKSLIYDSDDSGLDINPYDLKALTSALALKQYGFSIICLSMGAMASESVLRRCIAMGADEAVLLSDERFAGSDTFATSYVLSMGIGKIGAFDYLFCGEKAIDGETGQTSVGLAARLNISYFTNVRMVKTAEDKLLVSYNDQRGMVVMHLESPAMLVFRDCITDEPPVSLLALKKAKKQSIIVYNADDLNCDSRQCGQEGSKTKVIDVIGYSKERQGEVIDGSICEKAEKLLKIIS